MNLNSSVQTCQIGFPFLQPFMNAVSKIIIKNLVWIIFSESWLLVIEPSNISMVAWPCDYAEIIPPTNHPVCTFCYIRFCLTVTTLDGRIFKNGLEAEGLKVGSVKQIVLKQNAAKYSDFKVRGVKANGTIWTGVNDDTFEYFTADSVLDAKSKFNENPLSLAIKLSYGKFDYFTGGDNTGLQGYGLPKWFDTETPMARAVGKVEVTTLNHHGNRDATKENFLRSLQPKAVIEQTWCSDRPGQEVMHRLISNHIYEGEKNIFATNIQEVTKATLGFWFTRGYKSMFGHVIVRVLPGGNQFYILIAETIEGKVTIKRAFGPFVSE